MASAIHFHWWHWTALQWATVLSAAFAAAAAGAAWRSTRIAASVARASRVPQVTGAVLHNTPSGQIKFAFANAGPVLAVQVMYMAVVDGRMAFGMVGDGFIRVDEKIILATDIVSGAIKSPSYLVWGWRDLNDNVYFRTHDWTTKRISRRTILKRERAPVSAMFEEMYPGIDYSTCVNANTTVE